MDTANSVYREMNSLSWRRHFLNDSVESRVVSAVRPKGGIVCRPADTCKNMVHQIDEKSRCVRFVGTIGFGGVLFQPFTQTLILDAVERM